MTSYLEVRGPSGAELVPLAGDRATIGRGPGNTTGQRRPVGERAYTGPVTLIVSDSISDGEGGAERNPFHFTLQTDQQNGTGAFSISSAQVFTTPETSRAVALPYWTAVYDEETNALQAELTEDHREEAAAYNLVNVDQQLVPCNPQLGAIPMVAAMAEGMRLAGTLGDSGGSIEFAGTSSDGMYDFHVATELVRNS